MAFFRCSVCDYFRELPAQHLGKLATCPSCQAKTPVFDTLMVFANLLAEKKAVQKENLELHQQIEALRAELSTSKAENQRLAAQLKAAKSVKSTRIEKAGYAFAYMDDAEELQNTANVVQWFKQRQIEARINENAIDIAGYFDEVAVLLGDNFSTLKSLLNSINWAMRKDFDKASYELPANVQEAKSIENFCHTLYDYAFVAKYIHTKQDKALLILNKAHNIRKFFAGDWLEWYAFMKVASFFAEKKIEFSYLRSFDIVFHNGEQRELDLFFLINERPLWIECKSGEFRDSIDKYSKLRKTLGVDKEYLILLVANLEEEKAKSFSHMFDFTVATEKTFLPYIQTLFVK